jgi:hypothetical protein
LTATPGGQNLKFCYSLPKAQKLILMQFGTVQKEILLASPGQRLNRNGFLAFAEGTNNWLNAVFGPFMGQKLHKKEIFVPSAE